VSINKGTISTLKNFFSPLDWVLDSACAFFSLHS
jgi:hypothetical protein